MFGFGLVWCVRFKSFKLFEFATPDPKCGQLLPSSSLSFSSPLSFWWSSFFRCLQSLTGWAKWLSARLSIGLVISFLLGLVIYHHSATVSYQLSSDQFLGITQLSLAQLSSAWLSFYALFSKCLLCLVLPLEATKRWRRSGMIAHNKVRHLTKMWKESCIIAELRQVSHGVEQ